MCHEKLEINMETSFAYAIHGDTDSFFTGEALWNIWSSHRKPHSAARARSRLSNVDKSVQIKAEKSVFAGSPYLHNVDDAFSRLKALNGTHNIGN